MKNAGWVWAPKQECQNVKNYGATFLFSSAEVHSTAQELEAIWIRSQNIQLKLYKYKCCSSGPAMVAK